MFKVKQSDCRTGWLIVNYAGRVVEVEPCYRRREAAQARCDALNKPADHFKACKRCGQTVITRADVPMCATCKRLEARSQGETVRLFEPAPAQLEGQLSF